MSPSAVGISRQRSELGRWIYTAWKHLRSYSVQSLSSFESTALAGKGCDLLGRLRQLRPYSLQALEPLARDALLTRHELRHVLVPVLETLGVLQIARRGTSILSVQALVLSQADVMDQVARLWEALDPDAVERGAVSVLDATASLPLTRDEAGAVLSQTGLTDEEAEQAIELALSVDLVRLRHLADFGTDFLYNDFLWGENIARTTKALGALEPAIRSALRSLFDELHKHEGRPTSEIQTASPDLVRLAVGQGLIEATEIQTTEGKSAVFHFTPRFRGFGVSQDELPDVLDQVKLVMASFAFSTRYAKYKLQNPDTFIDSLIDRGYAGNASPIGTDYGAMERQRIVNVEPTGAGDRYRFVAVKRDALIEARDSMRAGALLIPNPHGSS